MAKGIKIFILLCFFSSLLHAQKIIFDNDSIKTGAENTGLYFPFIKGKKIAVIANQTSMIDRVHLIDSLRNAGMDIQVVFAPEHGFRGTADAGEHIDSYTDPATGIKVLSLYGKRKKPSANDLAGIDILIFDIQDVGARFYTFISTLHYIIEACIENKKELIILDRPNPNGFYVDGPVREKEFASFVGLDPIPVVHGMTIGELGQMIEGEGWAGSCSGKIKVIPCKGYSHKKLYRLPVAPSPNLNTPEAVFLYPSLCFFEGTPVSVGRGTPSPFTLIGFPGFKAGKDSFIPVSGPGSKKPLYENRICKGFDLKNQVNTLVESRRINWSWLIEMYNAYQDSSFFNSFFNKLAGNAWVQEMIRNGKGEQEIRERYQPELEKFMRLRKKYLLYPDFQ